MYMMDIVEITEETNFAFTLAALILSASMAVDTFAKQNQIAQAITFIMEICALLVIVLFPNLKSFIFLKKLMSILDTNEELKEWYNKSGLPLKRFFNTSGLLYKEMQLKDKLPTMNEEEQLKLLATNGMLVKRPLVVNGDMVLIGFKEAEWAEKLS